MDAARGHPLTDSRAARREARVPLRAAGRCRLEVARREVGRRRAQDQQAAAGSAKSSRRLTLSAYPWEGLTSFLRVTRREPTRTPKPVPFRVRTQRRPGLCPAPQPRAAQRHTHTHTHTLSLSLWYPSRCAVYAPPSAARSAKRLPL